MIYIAVIVTGRLPSLSFVRCRDCCICFRCRLLLFDSREVFSNLEFTASALHIEPCRFLDMPFFWTVACCTRMTCVRGCTVRPAIVYFSSTFRIGEMITCFSGLFRRWFVYLCRVRTVETCFFGRHALQSIFVRVVEIFAECVQRPISLDWIRHAPVCGVRSKYSGVV